MDPPRYLALLSPHRVWVTTDSQGRSASRCLFVDTLDNQVVAFTEEKAKKLIEKGEAVR